MLPRIVTVACALVAAVAACTAIAGASPPGWVWVVGATAALVGGVYPFAGVQLAAGLAPLGGAIAALSGLHGSATTPLLLSVVAGWLLGRACRASRWDTTAGSLAGLLALTVGASLAVQGVLAYEVAAPGDLTVRRALWLWISNANEALQGPQGPELKAALIMLAGCGAFLMSVEVCRDRPETRDAALALLTVGVAGVAALNVNRFFEVVLRQGTDFWPAAARIHQFMRVSSTIPDVNAAGALFALFLPVAIAGALDRSRRQTLWRACAVAIGAGLWLSGSRAAMAGGALGVCGYLGVVARRSWTRRRTAVALGALLVGLTALVAWYPRAGAHGTSYDAWVIRQQLARVGVAMTREAPLFGVGIGRFLPESARLASPELRYYYRAQNAHNQLVQVLGELGLAGAGLFVGLIGVTLVTAWRAQAPTPAGLGRALLLGIAGFLAASLLMHPLLLAEVSAAFWIALGLARSRVAARPARDALLLVPAIVAIGLLVSIPIRVAGIRKGADLSGLGVGLSAWRSDRGDHRRYREAEGAASIYADTRRGRLKVPLRARSADARPVDVEVRLDGHLSARLRLEPGQWSEVAMVLPPPSDDRPRFRRVDFRWTPTSTAARLDVGRDEVSAAAR